MRAYLLSILLGLTTTAAMCTPLPVQAKANVYQEVSGQQSIKFDAQTLAVLKSLGLSLASVESTAVPEPGFDYGWALIPPSADPNIRGTHFTFSYDNETGAFIPLGEGIEGVEEYATTLVFNVDTTKLALPPQLVLDGVSITLSPDRDFLSSHTAANGLPLLDLQASAPPVVDFDNKSFRFNGIKTYVSPEFSNLLVNAGASKEIAGLKFADTQGVYKFAEVPEPGNVLAILMTASAALVVRRQKH